MKILIGLLLGSCVKEQHFRDKLIEQLITQLFWTGTVGGDSIELQTRGRLFLENKLRHCRRETMLHY